MKFHTKRYGAVTALCVLAVGSMSIAALDGFKWPVVVIGAILSGLICMSLIPWEQTGDK